MAAAAAANRKATLRAVRLGQDLGKRWIVVKGALFLVLACGAAVLLFARSPTWQTAALCAVLAWAAARFYYFLFYVLHRWVDPELRYSGIGSLLRWLRRADRNAKIP